MLQNLEAYYESNDERRYALQRDSNENYYSARRREKNDATRFVVAGVAGAVFGLIALYFLQR